MKFKSNFLVITLICATLHSCENNDVEAFKEDSKQSLRVKEIVSYKNNVENEKVIFSYMGEKLDKIIFYNGNANQWLESSMNEFNYDGNLITNLTSYKNSSKWITEKKVEMRLNNNSIFESIEYTYQLNTWKPIYKSLYQYSGDRLLSWQGFGEIDKNGNLAQNQKGEFSYGGGKISQYIDYILIESSNWQLSEKHTCSYTEDKIKDIKG